MRPITNTTNPFCKNWGKTDLERILETNENWTKIAFLVLLLAATSCASRKKIAVPEQPKTFEWLTSNLDIQAEGNGMSFDDLSGQLRMRKDSLVWLSLTATMGIEVARIKVSSDSVWILNRLEKTYLAEPMKNVSEYLGIPLSLTLLQTLLLDNNEGLPPVENQIVLLKTFALGNLSAKVRYHHIKLDEKTTFPLKITDKMERYRFPKKGY